jgi:energy-coupling factor transporter ATP-binding protein EcfA2
MILTTGPTGSGKTTTLYTLMDILNRPDVNISTIEDPIEYQMKRINQTQVKPDIGFTFSEGQPLDFSELNYISNLSSLIAFYAYLITGMDYDTFSKFGGSPYFEKAQTVLDNAQAAPNTGWKAFENLRNRFWIMENLMNKSYNPIRESLYTYHREGMDVMAENQTKGRKAILSVIPQLQKIDRQKQGSILNQIFFSAKADELINILSAAEAQDKIKAYNALSVIDPANSLKYEILKKP